MEMKQNPQAQGGYAQVPGNQQTTVIVQQAPRPNSYLALSCLVYWCCNPLFGGIAFAFSMASKSASDDGDVEGARSRGKTACWLSIIGIILTVLAIVIMVILYFTAAHVLFSSLADIDWDQVLADGNNTNDGGNTYGGDGN
jgi:hypothetical protein